MLKSCKYCGKIHDNKIDCGKKPIYRKKNGRTNQFHSSSKRTETSKAIKSRDHYLCQACLNNLDGNGIRYTTEHLEVHHIIPIAEAWEMRLSWNNLITLCRTHHEMAENGRIKRTDLEKIVMEKE